MPLTIAQALKDIPSLQTARVVAGEQNLSQVIRWTHIIDHPDILPWVQEGYLLLTTAFALMLSPESQTDLIPQLAEKKLAGMMVNVGRYVGEIPPAMVAAAQKMDFPLIALPWEVNFTDVTHAIHERIINEQYALSEQVFHIHEVLTQIVVEGCGLDSLASTLADLLQRSVTIEDSTFHILAYKSIEPVDTVRERSIIEGRTPSEVIAYHDQNGLYERLKTERRPQKVNPNPSLGLTMERVVAPIIVGPHLFGYIWVIATDHPLTDLDFLAIERGAGLAALILSREQAVYEAEQRVKNKWFETLLDAKSEQESNEISDMLNKLGLTAGLKMMVIESFNHQPLVAQSQIIEACIHGDHLDGMVIERGGRLVVILPVQSDEKAREIGTHIIQHGTTAHCQFSIGISARFETATHFRAAYEEALKALRIGQIIFHEGGVWSSESLGYFIDLLDLPADQRHHQTYRGLIDVIADHDEKHDSRLLQTLDVYMDKLADIQKTAQALYIHRNTLYQRLEKISDLLHVDLKNTLTILNLYLALKDWRLEKHK